MYDKSPQQESYPNRISTNIKIYCESLGLFLAAYGAFFLSSVILNRHTITDTDKQILRITPTFINPILTHDLIDKLFFVTSLPSLIIGAFMLCVFSIRGIKTAASSKKQYVAILLTAFGFAYQVIGAWPLQHQIDFPWNWQKQIVSFGPVFTWTLEILSMLVLVVGVVSLYKHSVIYHQKTSNGETEHEQAVA
jgi:hypothetical protein